MANVVVTLNIMPVSPSIELEKVESEAKRYISEFAGLLNSKTEIVPIAFGLKAVKIIFVMDEDKGSTEILEENIAKINGVNSVEVLDVRRTIG